MVDRQQFIDAMRGVAHSVTIVTTDGEAGRHGATVSAFCSVSADPPMALVCLKAASRIADLVKRNKAFTVSVLPEHSRHLADRFAGLHDTIQADRFVGIETENGAPVVSGATVFECALDSAVISGSHEIVIGKVIACKRGNRSPLTYLDGAYHYIAKIEEVAA